VGFEFVDAQTRLVSSSSLVNRALTEAYDFSRFTRLVDVAGGYGSTLCAILNATPSLRGVQYDMPHVIEGAGARVVALVADYSLLEVERA